MCSRILQISVSEKAYRELKICRLWLNTSSQAAIVQVSCSFYTYTIISITPLRARIWRCRRSIPRENQEQSSNSTVRLWPHCTTKPRTSTALGISTKQSILSPVTYRKSLCFIRRTAPRIPKPSIGSKTFSYQWQYRHTVPGLQVWPPG